MYECCIGCLGLCLCELGELFDFIAPFINLFLGVLFMEFFATYGSTEVFFAFCSDVDVCTIEEF